MLKSPQQKGKQFERDTAKYLGKKFKANVRRTPCSGAIHDFMAQDIICLNPKSVLNELFMECKKQEHLNHHKVYWRTRGLCPVGKIPCVIHAKNFDKEPIITLSFEDFCNLLLRLEELELNNGR